MKQRLSSSAVLAAGILSAWVVPAQDPARLPVPDAAARKAKEAKVRELFRDGYAAKDAPSRRELAKKLLKSAERETSDKVLLHVLLQEAGDMAAKAVDPEIALEAAGRLGRQFEMDGTGLKIERMKGLARGVQGLEAQGAFVRAYDGLVLEVILERGPKDASQLTASAAGVAEKSGCALLQEKVRFWKDLLDECRE